MALKTQTLLFVMLAGASIAFAVLASSITNTAVAFIMALLSMALAIIAFSTKYYTYLYMPAFHMKNRNIVLNGAEPFTMSPSGNTILVSEENGIYASSFVTIPIYKSGTEMEQEERLDFAKLFNRMLTVTKDTLKISSQLYLVNKDIYIERIRKRLEESEAKLRTIQQDPSNHKGIERAKGEATMWHNLMNNIPSSKSEALITYAMVSAFGSNDEEASSIAYQRAEEVASGISAILGVSAYVATGDELLNYIEPDRMIPVETVNEMIRQKSVQEGV